MPVAELRSPFTRAVLPVLGGAAVIALIGGFTWAIAAYISNNGTESTERLAPSTFTIGNVEGLAESIATSGPLLFPELGTSIGTRSIVVDHEGDQPTDGWRVYWAYPADRDASCVVNLDRESGNLTDCDGRVIEASELAPPDEGVFPIVRDRTTLVIDLRGATVTTP